jgi:hypothetical protein
LSTSLTLSDDDPIVIPEDHILADIIFDAAPDMSIPYKVRVIILRELDHINSITENDTASATSITFNADKLIDGIGAYFFIPQETLEISVIAHECTHAALFWVMKDVRRKQRAYGWLANHPEKVPECIGNLTSILWYNLKQYRKDELDG